MSPFTSAGALIVQFVFGLLMFVVLLRVLMQGFRAPFQHPASQAIFRLTNPVFMPLQKVLGVVRGWHVGGILLLVLLATLQAVMLMMLGNTQPGAVPTLILGIGMALDFVFMTLFWLVLISVLMSWLAPQGRGGAGDLLHFVVRPLLAPFRKVIPPLGPLDISPMVLLLLLQLARILIAGPIMQLAFPIAMATPV